MLLPRLIARLDIKGKNVVKGIHLEGLRVVGQPHEMAKQYAEEADELLYIDTVASLYGRNQLRTLLEQTCEGTFIPITVGGGIRSVEDVRELLRAGADKCAINTAAVRDEALIQSIAGACGSQAIVVNIEAKRSADSWEALTDNGRERTGKDAVAWAARAVALGAGEILLTSVDQDGTRRGFDLGLIRAVAAACPSTPLVASGGMGCVEHALQAFQAGADAVAMASVLHYGKLSIQEVSDELAKREFRAGRNSRAGEGRSRSEGRVSEEGEGERLRLDGLCGEGCTDLGR